MTRASLALAICAAALAGAPPGYVEPDACRPCHQALYDRYLGSPMGRSFYSASQAGSIADWDEATFYHEASDRHYEMFRRGGTLYVRRYRLEDGERRDILERKVTHVMGSGERALSLLHQTPRGRLFELPVSWYSQEQAWAMAPGYDRADHPGFGRQVNHKCMFCHNAYPDVAPERARQGWDADVIFPRELPTGIDCQRCHGPGARHAETRAAKDIVNPAKLSPERSLETCMQCHYETTTFRLPDSLRRFGRGFYSYRPGEPLGDYAVHFDHAPGSEWDEKFEIVSAAYRLRQSACFQKSAGAMTCLDCHNPHDRPETEARPAHYRERCQSCHAAVNLDGHPQSGDCVACHMPLRRTEDVVHVAMTDHRIVRRPPPGDLLAPLEEKTKKEQSYRGEVVQVYPKPSSLDAVYRAVAQVKDGANLGEGVKQLEAALEAEPADSPEPWFELAEALRAAGRDGDAEPAYRRALATDPHYPQAWNNLANLLADSNRRTEALEAYREALKLTPWDAEVHVNLGLTFLEDGAALDALEAFQAAVAANPAHPDAHANLGALLLSLGRVEEAGAELETALALDPGHQAARANLRRLQRSNRSRAR